MNNVSFSNISAILWR